VSRDLDGATPLHHACRMNQDALVRLLVDAVRLSPPESDILSFVDTQGRTAAMYAAEAGAVDALEVLLDLYKSVA